MAEKVQSFGKRIKQGLRTSIKDELDTEFHNVHYCVVEIGQLGLLSKN